VTASSAGARQEGGQPDAPRLNQPGKDVQWVPTPPALVEKMLDLAGLTPKDRLVDLGSGDGVLVIAAARRGARARGIEYDRGLVEFSKRKAAEAGVSQLTRFIRGDIFKSDFSDATVVTTFLLPSMNLRLRPTFLAMKPGTRIVANTFAIADWQPDESVAIEPCERWCTALMWIVPAHVGGTWGTPKGDLTLTQKFQMVSGTLGKEPIENGRLRGEQVPGDEFGSMVETVRKVAELARLDLAVEEEAALSGQFASILEHFQMLSRLDVSGVEAMLGASRVGDVFREDLPRPSLPSEDVLRNAPAHTAEFYVVPKTVGAAGDEM
jgi:aspartyl/glutamyl-tRNA(Asn/Gln) amidotransferase C subunit